VQLATLVHPKFKTIELIQLLKRHVNQLLANQQSVAKSTVTILSQLQGQQREFFAVLAARRQNERSSALDEVDKYLANPSVDVSSLTEYSNIYKLYVRMNTGLPASAAVERLFSLGCRVFTPLRSRLSGLHFEMVMFLRSAK